MSAEERERARRIRLTGIVLGVAAFAIYVGFILMTVSRAG